MTKSAPIHEIQQICKQTRMHNPKYTSSGMLSRPRVTKYGQTAKTSQIVMANSSKGSVMRFAAPNTNNPL